MHRDDELRLQELARISRFARRHGEQIADRQHHQLRRIQLANDLHVAEHIRITCVIDLDAALQFHDITTRFAAVYDLPVVLDPARVVRMNHGDTNALNHLRSTLIHRQNLFRAFFL